MTCGARNEYNDVCGETYTCPSCRSGNEADRLCARIAELERVLVLSFNVIEFFLRDEGNNFETGVTIRVDLETKQAKKVLSEIKSVLGRK